MFEQAEQSTASLVVLGDFAPTIFHPRWFHDYGLLGKGETNESVDDKNFTLVPHLANFKVGQFEFQITRERFQVTTNREDYFEPMRDLAQGTFSILDNSPVRAIGFNWGVHIRTGSEAAWHAVGDRLTPKANWKELWPKHIGMQDVSMRLDRDDQFVGAINVSVQPSFTLQYAVYIGINDHFDFSAKESFKASDAAQFIKTEWQKGQDRAKIILEGIYSRFIKQ